MNVCSSPWFNKIFSDWWGFFFANPCAPFFCDILCVRRKEIIRLSQKLQKVADLQVIGPLCVEGLNVGQNVVWIKTMLFFCLLSFPFPRPKPAARATTCCCFASPITSLSPYPLNQSSSPVCTLTELHPEQAADADNSNRSTVKNLK